MPLPVIPAVAWIVVAIGVAISLIILALWIGASLPIISYGLTVLAAAVGLPALYMMLRDIVKAGKRKKLDKQE